MRRNRIPGFRFHSGRLMIFTEEEAKIIHRQRQYGGSTADYLALIQ